MYIPIFGPAVFTIRLAMAWLKIPAVEFHPPVNTATEHHLVWWHVPISLKYQWLKPFPLQDVSVQLTLSGADSKTLQLCWRSWEGPKHRMTLLEDELYYIPVVARTTFVSHMLATKAGMIIPPGSLGDWVMQGGIPRISDVQHCFAFTSVTNLVAPGYYWATLTLRVGSRVIARKSYSISVPPPDSANDQLVLAPR